MCMLTDPSISPLSNRVPGEVGASDHRWRLGDGAVWRRTENSGAGRAWKRVLHHPGGKLHPLPSPTPARNRAGNRRSWKSTALASKKFKSVLLLNRYCFLMDSKLDNKGADCFGANFYFHKFVNSCLFRALELTGKHLEFTPFSSQNRIFFFVQPLFHLMFRFFR